MNTKNNNNISVNFNCLRPIVGLINRDDENEPKQIKVAGRQRIYVSPQCTKFNLLKFLGIRTMEKFSDKNFDQLKDMIINYDDEKDKYKYIQISKKEFDKIADLLANNGKTKTKKKKSTNSDDCDDTTETQEKGKSGDTAMKLSLKALNLFYNSDNKSKENLEELCLKNIALGTFLTGAMFTRKGGDTVIYNSLISMYPGISIGEADFVNDFGTCQSDMERSGAITLFDTNPSAYILHYGCALDCSGMVDVLVNNFEYDRDRAVNEVANFVALLYKALRKFNYSAKESYFGYQEVGRVHFTITNAQPVSFFSKAFQKQYNEKDKTTEDASEFLAEIMDEYYKKEWENNMDDDIIKYECFHDTVSKDTIESVVKNFLKQ